MAIKKISGPRKNGMMFIQEDPPSFSVDVNMLDDELLVLSFYMGIFIFIIDYYFYIHSHMWV